MPVACRIVADEGVAAASVRRVAQEADVTPSALRVQWPTQEALHCQAARWASTQFKHGWPRWEDGKDLAVHLREMLTELLPADDEQLMYARACAAFALAGDENCEENSDLRGVMHQHHRHEVHLVTTAIRQIRGLLGLPLERRVIIASEWAPPEVEDLDPTELHLLLLVVGLTELMARRDRPLPRDRAARWVGRLTLAHLDLPA